MKDFVFKALVVLVFALGAYYASGAVLGFGLLAVIATVFLVEFYLAFREQPKFRRVVNDIDEIRKYGFAGNPDWRPEVCALGEMENALGHVQKVGARILLANKLKIPTSFTVYDTPVIAAEAYRRQIAVTYGLYRDCRSEDELAAVLGHEIGHLVHRQEKALATLVQKIPAEKGQSQLIRFAADPEATELYDSRCREYEADRLSVQYLTQAGYDPTAFGRVLWRHLSYKVKEGATDVFDDSRSTHPTLIKRIARANQEVADEG
jgi:Zn-dependent protease with chaperone function